MRRPLSSGGINSFYIHTTNARKKSIPFPNYSVPSLPRQKRARLSLLILLVLIGDDAHLLVHELIGVTGAGVQDLEVASGVLGAGSVARVATKDVPDVACKDGSRGEESKDGPVAHAVHGGVGTREEEGGGNAARVGDGDHAAGCERGGGRALDGCGTVLDYLLVYVAFF